MYHTLPKIHADNAYTILVIGEDTRSNHDVEYIRLLVNCEKFDNKTFQLPGSDRWLYAFSGNHYKFYKMMYDYIRQNFCKTNSEELKYEYDVVKNAMDDFHALHK